MSASRGQLHRARGRRRRSSSARRCGSRTRSCRSGTRSSWTREPSRRRSDGGEARARARSSSRRSHGDEAATQAEDHFTRVVREGSGARGRAGGGAAGDGDGAPAGAPRRASRRRSTSEARRLIAQGGGQGERRGRRASSTCRARRSTGRSFRPESGVSCAFAPLDTPLSAATIRRLLDERRRKVPVTRQLERLRTQSDTTQVPEISGGLWRESEVFLRPSHRQRSLKTQQRETSRPRAVTPARGLITRHALDRSRAMTFELKLIAKLSTPASVRQLTTIFTESLILAQDERWRRA